MSASEAPGMTTGRLEAFSDGVFAVAATLLVVDLHVVIPFPTALLGRFATAGDDGHLASALYGTVMVLMSVAFTTLWLHVTRDARLIGRHLDPHRARRESVLFSAGLAAYVAGIGLSFVSAPLALLLYALIAVFYVFPWLPPVSASPT